MGMNLIYIGIMLFLLGRSGFGKKRKFRELPKLSFKEYLYRAFLTIPFWSIVLKYLRGNKKCQ